MIYHGQEKGYDGQEKGYHGQQKIKTKITARNRISLLGKKVSR